MVEAPVIKCAVCGGPAQAGDRSCRFCGAGIATVRCGFCFHQNTVEALHCAGCGGELGPALETTEAQARCSECRSELMAFESPGGTLFSCERCGGQFVQHALLRSLLEQPALIGHAAPSLTLPPVNPLAERVHYRPCPVCGAVMNRKNFGGKSGVIVDVCARHGTWFDPGELPRVLEFVRQGGLEHERLRQQERERSERTQARVAERLTGSLVHPAPEPGGPGNLLAELLAFLEEMLRR